MLKQRSTETAPGCAQPALRAKAGCETHTSVPGLARLEVGQTASVLLGGGARKVLGTRSGTQ